MIYAVEVVERDKDDDEEPRHVFAVGIRYGDGEFTELADFETEMLAYAFVNYLNGGEGAVFEAFKK